MSARYQPSPTQRRSLPLSIRHEVDATLFGRVEAAHRLRGRSWGLWWSTVRLTNPALSAPLRLLALPGADIRNASHAEVTTLHGDVRSTPESGTAPGRLRVRAPACAVWPFLRE